MSLDHLHLDAISKADIERLVSDQVQEGKAIDFKTALPGKTDAEKKEFRMRVAI